MLPDYWIYPIAVGAFAVGCAPAALFRWWQTEVYWYMEVMAVVVLYASGNVCAAVLRDVVTEETFLMYMQLVFLLADLSLALLIAQMLHVWLGSVSRGMVLSPSLGRVGHALGSTMWWVAVMAILMTLGLGGATLAGFGDVLAEGITVVEIVPLLLSSALVVLMVVLCTHYTMRAGPWKKGRQVLVMLLLALCLFIGGVATLMGTPYGSAVVVPIALITVWPGTLEGFDMMDVLSRTKVQV